MAFYDTSRPFHGRRQAAGDGFHAVMLTVPRGVLPVPANLVKSVIAVPFDGRRGMAALLVDLMVALLGQELGADATRAVSPESRHRVLRTAIHSFIEQRLGDPELTPRTIAAAHHISLRLLHRLFHADGGTVAGSIRDARLRRCGADLAEPLCADWSIRRIAARRGFTNYAHFSSLFRSTYGVSPRDWRHQHRP